MEYQVQSQTGVCLVMIKQQFGRIDVFQNGEGRRKEEKKERKEGGAERITKSERSEGCSPRAHSTGKGPGAGKGSVCSKTLPWFQDHYNQFC